MIQCEGTVQYMKEHNSEVKGVAFSPTDRYMFVSGAYDGKINVYNANSTSQHSLIVSYQLSANIGRNITALSFTLDGRRILTAITARKLGVLDLERGEPINFYDNCCFASLGRLPMAVNPFDSNQVVCCSADGKGLTLFDLRMPLPYDFMSQLHDTYITDLMFLNRTWPFVSPNRCALASVSDDGTCKIMTLEGRVLHCFDIGHTTNTITCSPGPFLLDSVVGYPSVLTLGGDQLSDYTPHHHSDQPVRSQHKMAANLPSLQLTNHSLVGFTRQSYTSSNLNYYASLTSQPSLIAVPSLTTSDANRSRSLIASNTMAVSCNHCVARTMMLNEKIIKVRYVSNGGLLFAACTDCTVKKIRRHPSGHRLVCSVIKHKDVIYDMDISPYDEFLITGSKDKSVGVMYLGTPNHGSTGYCELT